jgi:hypothetical protein
MDGRRSPAFAGGPDSVEDRYFDQREAISTQPVLEPCLYLNERIDAARSDLCSRSRESSLSAVYR